MNDADEAGAPIDVPTAETDRKSPASDERHVPSLDEAHRLAGSGSAAASMDEIDREVAQAMAEMSAVDRAELSGASLDHDSLAPGTELTGTVVNVNDNDVFLEFGSRSQGVLPRLQFGKKEALNVGRRVDVVVERFDADAGLLIVNRKGTIQRATWTNLSVGQVVEGRVTGVVKGGLELSLSGIRGFMPASQVDLAPMKDISLLLNQVVRCKVIELDRRAKNVLVSRRKVLEQERRLAREALKQELAAGQTRRGVVKAIMDFGAFVDLGGVDGLVHVRDMAWGSIEKVGDVLHVGQEVEVRVLKVDRERDRISLGMKQCLPDPWVGVEERYPVGTALKARVVRLANFGAFVELEPGVEGLVPISEMSWGRLRNPSEVVSIGDVVDAVVLRLELEKRRLALSLKQAQPDPWDGILGGFEVNGLVRGKVTRLTDFGAFVELLPGVEGLIHISELSNKRVRTCGDVLQPGQEVETRVLGVDRENRRISLSIKAVEAPAPAEPRISAPQPAPQTPKKRKKPLRGGLASHFDW